MSVNDRGLGPVALGSDVPSASKALGVDIPQVSYHYGDVGCTSYALGPSEEEWDIRFIVEYGKIRKIDIFTDAIKTSEGAGVGMPMGKVKNIYSGRYTVEGAHQWPEKTIKVKLPSGASLEFTGPQLDPEEWKGKTAPRPEEVVRVYSIGFPGAGSVEGCL